MNFKVKCVGYNSDDRGFTLGKIYQVKDGVITSNHGYKYTAWAVDKGDFNELRNWFTEYFAFELVEDKKVFTKKDLRNGDFVELNDGSVGVVIHELNRIVYQDGEYN